jgi:hypothetical protein
MKRIRSVVIARPVKVLINSRRGHQWGQIKDAVTNKVLHTGRLPYIKRTALKRYNHKVTL